MNRGCFTGAYGRALLLQFLHTATMPRGQKSKLRAREKRRQVREEGQGLQGAQSPAVEEGKSPSLSSAGQESASPSICAAGGPQGPQGAQAASSSAAALSSDKGASHAEEQSLGLISLSALEKAKKDPLGRVVNMLMHFLLYKYKMKELIVKADMLKVIDRKYKKHFPEILQKATDRMELMFGLDLKEIGPTGHSYIVISKMSLSSEGSGSEDRGFPKNGLLMPLLAVIFMNDNCATELAVWEILNMLGVYDGKRHFVFGEPRKFITKDLVREEYLVYRQIAGSDPPCYEFLWGPRAYAETSKMQVLEFLAKLSNTVPSYFQSQYEEALREEEARAQARIAARASRALATKARASRSSQH
ncbi:melanoma-associated antigen B17 isoform X1 [Heterocephalus glaber]|uniref:Melanoma-associated antigen B17 isoform X1 n=1 Tax=Heterocephalus glaber TaxID=10181 RepID=A0AAX6RX29_HETGA|nr:melanoma-associated antigen B17 isoform X1 [Heterocephalus glaber]